VQFAPVYYNGRTFLPGQANKFYIFPAIGMAIFATQAKRVTDAMFIEAGQAVADQVPSDLLNQGLLYPLQADVLETEIQTAARVAKLVFHSGLSRVERPTAMVAFHSPCLQDGIPVDGNSGDESGLGRRIGAAFNSFGTPP
jgi:malate dehydrogenase (oxaloacetate-decarboxylating)(NADP+)